MYTLISVHVFVKKEIIKFDLSVFFSLLSHLKLFVPKTFLYALGSFECPGHCAHCSSCAQLVVQP
jgi:hypothetical protein